MRLLFNTELYFRFPGTCWYSRRLACPSLPRRYELPQVRMALPERALSRLERPLVRAVLHLDAHRALVAGVSQDRKETAPIDIAEAGELRAVVLERSGQDP